MEGLIRKEEDAFDATCDGDGNTQQLALLYRHRPADIPRILE